MIIILNAVLILNGIKLFKRNGGEKMKYDIEPQLDGTFDVYLNGKYFKSFKY